MHTATIFGFTLMVAAVSAITDTPYDYGYDDEGERSSLLKLFDALYIHSFLQWYPGNSEEFNSSCLQCCMKVPYQLQPTSSPQCPVIGSFLPSPAQLLNPADPRLKDLTLSLIQAARHLETLDQLDHTPVNQAITALLTEVMGDTCAYFQETLALPEDFNCTLPQLISLQSRLQLADLVSRNSHSVFQLLGSQANVHPDYRCAFWNARVLQNCTVSTPELALVQATVQTHIERDTSVCTFCPTQ